MKSVRSWQARRFETFALGGTDSSAVGQNPQATGRRLSPRSPRGRCIREVKRVGIRASTRPTMASGTMTACSHWPSFAAALVASYWFLVEIALRGAVTPCLLWHGTAGATSRDPAMTAEHRRAKTRDRILRRDERRVSVLEPVPLCAFPWRGARRKSRISPERRCYNHEPRTKTDSNKESGRSELDDAPAPPSAIG